MSGFNVRPGVFVALAAILLLVACGNDDGTTRATEPDRATVGKVGFASSQDAEAVVHAIRSGGLSREEIGKELDATLLQSIRRIDAAVPPAGR